MITLTALLLLAVLPAHRALEDPSGRWAGSMEMAGHALTVTGWIETEGASPRATLHVPQLGAMALHMDGEIAGATLQLTGSVEGLPLVFEGRLAVGSYEGSWSWAGRGGPFHLRRTGSLPPPYEEFPVTFRNGDVELAGTVILPAGPGPFAGVVWAHGSGHVGRRSRSYVREPYVLALAGVASLIYDKRGVGQSTGDWRTASFDDLAHDAVAARQALIAFDRVDEERTGVGGISQASSWIAPLACRFDPGFAFALILSATGRTPAEQHLWVVECRVRNAGFGDEEVALALDLHRRLDRWQRDGGDARHTLDAELQAAQAQPWSASALLPGEALPLADHVRGWMWMDPLPLWKATEVVAFGCWGEADQITNPRISQPLLAEALGERMTSHLLPGAKHEFDLEGPPPPRMSPDLHPLLLAWMRGHGLLATP